MNRSILIPLLATTLGSACGGVLGGTFSPETLEGPTWQLLEIAGVTESPPSEASVPITLSFSEDGRMNGSAGCNRYFGEYRTTDGTLDLSQVGVTRMACDASLMDREDEYLDALERVGGWERSGDRLVLLDATGHVVLRFVAGPTPTPPLEGR